MKFIHYDYTFEYVPQVMKRGEHVLVAALTPERKIILGRKDIYPKNIVRLVGGGVDPGEKSQVAAAREVFEELGVKIDPKQLKRIARISADLYETSTKREYTFITYLYSAEISVPYTPADDLDGVVEYNKAQLQQLVKAYGNLSTKLWESGKYGSFRWSDYGEFYGEIHQLVLDEGLVN